MPDCVEVILDERQPKGLRFAEMLWPGQQVLTVGYDRPDDARCLVGDPKRPAMVAIAYCSS